MPFIYLLYTFYLYSLLSPLSIFDFGAFDSFQVQSNALRPLHGVMYKCGAPAAPVAATDTERALLGLRRKATVDPPLSKAGACTTCRLLLAAGACVPFTLTADLSARELDI